MSYYFQVYPESVPFIDGSTVRFLFTDFKLETLGDVAQIPRLASSLSACAQLNTLSATQRTWALHRLRKLVMSEVGPAIDVPALFGYNLMYDQPRIKMKRVSNQRMNAVCTLPLIYLGYLPSLFGEDGCWPCCCCCCCLRVLGPRQSRGT